MIVAGEASGEMYGAQIASAIRALSPETRFFGMGGNCMREAGVETLVDANVMAVMGLVEVVAHLPTIVSGFTTLKKKLLTDPPDLLILIDYPDFNLRLAKVAKKAGIKVLYFISPQVWAWRSHRVHGIGRVVDMMAVLFPFEVPFYQKAGVPVTFVGHPLLDLVKPTMKRDEALASLGLDPQRRCVGLFPGSRRSELQKLLPIILESARILKERMPDLQFVLPRATSLKDEDLAPYLSGSRLEVKVVAGRNHDVMSGCDAVIAASGTVVMELALVGVPHVIIYKMSTLTYEIGKRVINVPHIGISNIVAEKRMVQELLQHEAEPAPIADEIDALLNRPGYAAQMREDFAAMRVKLGNGGALGRVARLALEMMK
ncbi:lipid-A-disaccharide synthase [Geomonas oryzisoli]|uniref:Lipid-A-disaccharide synthase n=1 Tax=Geomonas oryzisoli TaxID=2847992 RepID=A0ABX8JGD8_9BACT|nr:lipid-A-disaccharide synthase [Geomonas oryzisoli]QWV95757.1 lipid-A-disaccharide synthase [Geomonas oryzisoli]